MDNFNLKYSVSSDEDSNVSTTQYMFSNAGIGMDESTQQLNEKCGEIFVERIYDSEVFSFTCVFCDKATFTEISDFFEHFKYFHTKSCCISRKSDPLEINNDENNEEIIKIEDSIHQTDLNKEFETIVKDSNELVTNSDTFLKSEEPNRNLYAGNDSNGENDEECVLENSVTTIFHSDDIGDGNRPLENSNELATNSDTFLKSEEPNKNLYAVAVDDSNGEDDEEVTTILHSDDVGDSNSPLENSNINVCTDKSINMEEPSDNGMFSCLLCEKKYTAKTSLQRHVKNAHISPNDFVKCSHCDRSVKRHYLKEHERIHTSKEEFKCKFCNKCFQLPSYLKKHERLHLGIKPQNRKQTQKQFNAELYCNICKRQFTSDRTLEKHALACRADYEHTKFVTLDIISSESSSTQMNCENEENVKDDDSNESIKLDVFAQPHDIDPFMCRYCFRRCKNKTKRMQHECLHTGEKLFKCERCDKRFRLKTQLRVHLRVHDGIKPYKCNYCDAAFTHAQNRNVHEKRHLGEKKFKCNYCDMRFVASTERRHHERSHTGEKPYQCNECGQCYPTTAQLSIHSKIHSGIKPFKCELCDKCFITKKRLRQHAVVHTDKRPFECKECNAKFRRIDSLTSHRKIHSDVAAYICKICGKGFKQQPGLYCHMKSHGIPMKS